MRVVFDDVPSDRESSEQTMVNSPMYKNAAEFVVA